MNKLAQLILDDADQICDNVSLNDLSGKSVLITGASGLLGSYFLASISRHMARTNSVVKTYAIVRSEPVSWFREMCSDFGATILQGDLADSDFIDQLPSTDYVIHASGYAQPEKFMNEAVSTLKLNTLATFALLDLLKPYGKFLYVSSSEIYSGLQKARYEEADIGTTTPFHPRACYIEGKRSGEAICNSYRRTGTDVKVARLALAYGPGTRKYDKRVMSHFIQQAIESKEIRMRDQGDAKRTYCYVTDAVEVMWDILLKGNHEVYNVGGESRTTIARLAKDIGECAGANVVFPEAVNEVVGAPMHVSLSLERTKKEFNKHTYVPLEIGLKRTIEWQKLLYEG